MVRGIEKFQSFFKEVSDSFVVLGGAACQEWFAQAHYPFRSTKNIDIFLVPGPENKSFSQKFWDYLLAANYSIRELCGKKKTLFRFSRTENIDYPEKIELLSHPDIDLQPPPELGVTLMQFDKDIPNLSAVLLQEDYYQLALKCREQTSHGLPLISPGALLLLKIKAFLDLETARGQGKLIWRSEIKKHRNDVFRLVFLLDEQFELQLPKTIQEDLNSFLIQFSEKNPAWQGIRRALIDCNLPDMTPSISLSKIQSYYNS